ncbi:hypothetical protein [Moheibacter stercoris]|uniref:Uncharacterized protein n=1 Tax=Moheibacter stercoris TaxID=1628251 RepID=A0ABV2LWQ2_9FLAO
MNIQTKNKLLNKFIWVLILLAFFLAFWPTKFIEINSFDVPTKYYVIGAVLLTVMVLFLIETKFDFLTIINTLWVFPICLLGLYVVFDSSNLSKIDFLFTKEIKEFGLETKNFENRKVHEFFVENDTIRYNERNREYEGDYRLFKSSLSENYYLKMK